MQLWIGGSLEAWCKVQGKAYPFFYNPMWSRFGDGNPGPPGTFYHRRSEHHVYFWNMFDQVLIRPSLLHRFDLEDPLIIEHTGEQTLLTGQGKPSRQAGSRPFANPLPSELMGANMGDLWPDDLDAAIAEMRSPLSILKEQASLLGAKTKNIVKAKVVRTRNSTSLLKPPRNLLASINPGQNVSGMTFWFAFLIHSPALGDYQYRLFEVSYGVEFYPVRLHIDEAIVRELQVDPEQEIVVDDEAAFVDILSRILKSQRTRQVIQAILLQTLEVSDSNPAHETGSWKREEISVRRSAARRWSPELCNGSFGLPRPRNAETNSSFFA